MDEPTSREVHGRLNRLERECRRWRLAGIGAVSLVAVILIAGGDEPVSLQANRLSVGDLEARKLVLKDEQGRRWFSLDKRSEFPVMMIEGPNNDGTEGAARILLTLSRDGTSHLSVAGKDDGHISLGVNPAGDGHLSLSGRGGMITLGMGDDGLPQLMLWDKERGRVRLRLKADGSEGVEILEEKDAPRLQKRQSSSGRSNSPRSNSPQP